MLILAWIFLLVWIWWKGPTWTLYEEQWLKPLANRWLATAAWGIIALMWLTVRVMKRLQQLEKMQKQQREEAVDPLSVELNAQQRYLDRWLLRLQRHLDNRRFLWQLPWYMVIGPAGSGKTTLLREGFPSDIIYAPEGARGAEQRLYLTPHVGKQAVIFDIDGTLCAPADADILHRRLWEHALGWLKEKRARQPLNGIILTLDLPDLLTADKRRREHLLQALRSRLQDIRQHLHCQLPVYVVLTRLDLLQGFAALFQSLNRQDRDAILGVTFTRRAHENDDWRTELNAFWQTWVDRMNLALPDLMVAQTHTRASLFSFSRQMQGSREPLVSLLEGLLDGENMNVMLRGVYLTSSLQRGQMDDIFTQSAARQYRLGNNPLASWPLVDTAPYFTRSLFPQALLAEPNLATESRAWLIRSRRRLTVFSATGGVAALLLITGWHHYYNGNYQSGITVLKQAKAFMDVPPPQGEDDFGNLQLPLLNPVRDATLAYGDWGDRSRLADMGLYQGRRIGPYVEQTYLQLLEQRYLPSLFNGLVKALNAAPPESEEKLAVLRVMRMLEDKSGRNNQVVKQYMAKRWSEKFHGQRDIQAQLMSHLDYALAHTDWHAERQAGDGDAISRWVGRLTDQAWHVVMVEAVHYMEVDWRDSVVKPFNEQLANNYPFNPRSAQDASLDAFERFFKPDGILDTFYQQNLKLFIDNDLSLEDGDNNVIIREDIIAQLETAQKIRDIFFSKQNGLGTSFAVETVSLSGNKRRSVLNLDGQLVDYSQGRNYTAHLVWPNNMREGNESKLTLIGTSGNAPRSISFSGPWAQFRLFGAGQLTGVQDGNFTVRFSVDGGAMTYRVHTDTEDNPFSGGLFSQFGLSDTLY
ncbi:type VI secretion system membrane subunit TssM [Escherichia coli]|uniref:type VI secretion system membrane subunit TssM n=1 Tax=Escherichia coli TaxID=562 RepID=UPI000F0AB90B|nr:type VI secretion system membrane subunit TssM [Escherichia coli]